ncbi:hypothetical protein [Arthrobacter sp. QXT-31]|uniref:hypothetical protein n=1 Tax=Arthrobacter sp. QXT-31 TaxID=1357915 RepID=UPI0012F8F668|nr:hypothetical protein [Arthrobacter sp. QXT-31]
MANKSRRRRLKKRNTRSGHPAGRRAPRPVLCAPNQRDQEMGSLIEFITWHREHGTSPDNRPVLEHMMKFFTAYAHISDGAAVTEMDPELIAALVASLIEYDAELAASFCASLHEYIHFLVDTGRWSGTREGKRALHTVVYHGMHHENLLPRGGRGGRPAPLKRLAATTGDCPGKPTKTA